MYQIVHKLSCIAGFYSGQTIVVSDKSAEPNGVGLLQAFDGREYWGEWLRGQMHGWGVCRTIDGEYEYRGEFREGKYYGLGILREGAVSKLGRWFDGTLVLPQRLSPSAIFAARDAAIRAGCAAACSFPDEARATAEAVLCSILAATELQCAKLEMSRKQLIFNNKLHYDQEGGDDLRLIRNVGDEPEFIYWGNYVIITFLNEDTRKLQRKTLPHLWGRQTSVAFGWVYRGQFDSGLLHGLGGVVWNRLEIVNGELRRVSETYIGNWQQGRREGRGAFVRSDGTSEQGLWQNNNLVEEFGIDVQELMSFQSAVEHGEAIAMKAEALAGATSACASFTQKKISKELVTDDEVGSDDIDPYSTEYIAKLMELLIQNSQNRDSAHLEINRKYEADCQRVEHAMQQEAAAHAAHAAALAGDSDSSDDCSGFCTLGTAFFADRVYFGDSPVNVGILFDSNSKPSIVKEFSPNFNGLPHGFGCLWQQIGTTRDREMSFFQGEFKNGMAHGWGEKKSSAGTYRGQFEKDKRHGLGEWTFPDGSVSVSYWHCDSVVKPAFMSPQLRQDLHEAIHKARVSAVAAGCTENLDVHPDEVAEWRRLRESRVVEAKRKCAVELAIATNKYLGGDVGFSTLPRGTPFHEKKSFEDLKKIDRDNTQLDINNLEKYLNEEDFEEAFGISSFAFRLLKPQDQKLLKSRAGLLPEKHTSKKLEDNSSKQKGNQIYRATLIKKSKAAKALALSKHDS